MVFWHRRTPLRNTRRSCFRRSSTYRPQLQILEDRCVPAGTVTITSLSFSPAVEGQLANPSASATFTDTAGLAATALTATIDYGDGAALSTAGITRVGATTSYTVTNSHTYPEESGGFGFNATLHVFENASPATNTDTLAQRVVVTDAALTAGTLPAGVTHTEFSGVGGTNTSGGALTALNAFEAAIGGVKNTAPAPQNGGFRTITWDGVAVDGTDFGGNTTVIVPNKVVGIPINRFQTQGSLFETIYAVSADGFQSVNPNVAAASPALFPAFSPTKTFAMFNDNGIDFSFIRPSGANTAAAPAASRGFGAIFLNVRLPNTTSIEFFNGDNSLGKFFVPVGTQGQAEFLGELFNSSVVTRVSLILGTDVLFSFNGTTFSAGAADNPGAGHNLVDTDDFIYAEPVAAPALFSPVSATAGTLFNSQVATLTDANPAASFKDFTGSIKWGDGFTSPATFTASGSGTFTVNGSHTYAFGGAFPVSVLVQDFGGNNITLNNTAQVKFATHNQRFVAQVFVDLLNRPVDPAGLLFFGGLLDAGLSTRTQVAQTIMSSLEFRVDQVTAAYQLVLNRIPDPVGLNAFVSFLNAGGTLEQLKVGLAGSPEFFALAQSDTNAAATTPNQKFVDFLFQRVLARSPDATALAFFSNELTAHMPQATVAAQIILSTEGLGDAVNGAYQLVLHHPADANSLNTLVNALQKGFLRDEQIIAALVASEEFFGLV
jgi:hypothetical protein